MVKKSEPDIEAVLREIVRRASEAGQTPREYLDGLLRELEEARRADVVKRRAARRARPS